jgi:hypothetical protein
MKYQTIGSQVQAPGSYVEFLFIKYQKIKYNPKR